MATTALTLISGALQSLGVIGEAEVASGGQAADGLRRLNLLLGSWALQSLTIPAVTRSIFPVVAFEGSYTYGPGGTWDAPASPTLEGINLVLSASPPTVESALVALTDAAYQGLAVKGLTNGIPTQYYFSPTFGGGLATVSLVPIPTTAINPVAVYRRAPLQAFPSLVAEVDLPLGADEALEANLVLRLAPSYQVPIDADMRAFAASSLAILKRAHTPFVEIPNDYLVAGPGYDITLGNG